MKLSKIVILFVATCLIFTNSVFAKRFGGGRSMGMQRSFSKPGNYNNYNAQPRYNQPQPAPAMQQQPHQGMKPGTAAVLGAAAGAAGGYMLGKSMSDSNHNNVAASGVDNTQAIAANNTENKSSIPWGLITILGGLLIVGLIFFRKKADPSLSGNNNSTFTNPNQTGFTIPTINQNNSAQPNTFNNPNAVSGNNPNIQPGQIAGASNLEKMPDGVETIYFLRQVKGMFLHIQSMNNTENLGEVAKYMTPELFNETKAEISGNSFVADFSNLDCQLIECLSENNQFIASVKFFGLVSEEPNQTPKPFSEVWNFVKSDLTNGKWLVAGVQQETLA